MELWLEQEKQKEYTPSPAATSSPMEADEAQDEAAAKAADAADAADSTGEKMEKMDCSPIKPAVKPVVVLQVAQVAPPPPPPPPPEPVGPIGCDGVPSFQPRVSKAAAPPRKRPKKVVEVVQRQEPPAAVFSPHDTRPIDIATLYAKVSEIRDLMASRCLSQRKVADMAGVKASQVFNFLHRKLSAEHYGTAARLEEWVERLLSVSPFTGSPSMAFESAPAPAPVGPVGGHLMEGMGGGRSTGPTGGEGIPSAGSVGPIGSAGVPPPAKKRKRKTPVGGGGGKKGRAESKSKQANKQQQSEVSWGEEEERAITRWREQLDKQKQDRSMARQCRGVYPTPNRNDKLNKWVAMFGWRMRSVECGRFRSVLEAAQAYDDEARQRQGRCLSSCNFNESGAWVRQNDSEWEYVEIRELLLDVIEVVEMEAQSTEPAAKAVMLGVYTRLSQTEREWGDAQEAERTRLLDNDQRDDVDAEEALRERGQANVAAAAAAANVAKRVRAEAEKGEKEPVASPVPKGAVRTSRGKKSRVEEKSTKEYSKRGGGQDAETEPNTGCADVDMQQFEDEDEDEVEEKITQSRRRSTGKKEKVVETTLSKALSKAAKLTVRGLLSVQYC
jgi:hypothetical protein